MISIDVVAMGERQCDFDDFVAKGVVAAKVVVDYVISTSAELNMKKKKKTNLDLSTHFENFNEKLFYLADCRC